jgi:hypothetical protein
MKKTLLFSFAAAAAMSAVTTANDAMAWETNKAAAVFIVNGYQKVCVGKWITELNQYTDYNGYEACSYFVKWIDDAYLPMTSNLFLDELVVPGYLDCELNSCLNFRTLLFNSPDYLSTGFDKFQQKKVVKNLILTTDGYGMASGIITFNTNFPYPLVVKDP